MTRIRELREKKGLLQKQLAHELNIAANTFNQYETGKRVPDIETLQKIASYFHVSIDYLMGLDKTIVPIGYANIELEYIEVIKEAKANGFSADDLRLAVNMLEMARKK